MKTESEMHKNGSILSMIAMKYPDGSAEQNALQKAAIALHLVYLNNLGYELEEIHEGIGKQLIQERSNQLRSMGIDLDE